MAQNDYVKGSRMKTAIIDGRAYTSSFMSSDDRADRLRSYAVERNRSWMEEFREFSKFNTGKTPNDKVNKAYYGRTIRYDAVVPKRTYDILMSYYDRVREQQDAGAVVFFEKRIDHIMMLVNKLYHHANEESSCLRDRRGNVSVYCMLLDEWCGRDHEPIIGLLESLGLLEVNRYFKVGRMSHRLGRRVDGQCRKYSLAHAKDAAGAVYQVTNRVLVKNAYAHEFRDIDDVGYANKPGKIEQDVDAVEYFAERFDMSDEFRSDREEDYNGFTYYYRRICTDGNRFRNFQIGRDAFGHRFHHPFLNVKRSSREHILIDGSLDKRVIDISNSHPYIFSMLFDERFLSYASPLMTETEVELFRTVSSDPLYADRIDVFKRITSTGNYRRFLEENIDVEGKYDAKTLSMIYFYGAENKRNRIYRLFDEGFEFVNLVKHAMIRLGGRKRLCQLLQRIESKLMVEDVFFELARSGVSVIPFHDAIMCKPSDYDLVRGRILDVFRKIGVKYMPDFDKKSDISDIYETLDRLRFDGGSKFVNRCLVMEGLNAVIRSAGIRNRVFRDDMKPETVVYIDGRFDRVRNGLSDEVIEEYDRLRAVMDSGESADFDYSELYEEYKGTAMQKRRYYSRTVVAHVKINPIEFLNYKGGFNLKTRVSEHRYMY